LRMVLEHFGTVRSEAALRDLCDCNPVSILIRGLSESLKVVNAARALGLSAAKHNMGFEELERQVGRGAFPIVNIMTRFTDSGPRVEHAVVVVGIAKDQVEVNDPWRGQYVYAKDDFIREWSAAYGLTILISKAADGDG